jgi:hypothetical protein
MDCDTGTAGARVSSLADSPSERAIPKYLRRSARNRDASARDRADRFGEHRLRAVLEAQGSVMTNKYAEGYPGRRYYGGCEFVDIAENLAIDRARQLFNCQFANVQPNSGSQANQGVFQALAKPGDTILGHEPRCRRPPDPRRPAQPVGQVVQCVQYGVRREDGTGSISTRSRRWPSTSHR